MQYIEHQEEHGHSTTPYFIVYGILIALLVATVALAYVHFGMLNMPIALLVATIKASLVVWIFMHVRENPPIILLTILLGVLMLAIFLGLLMMDYLTRY